MRIDRPTVSIKHQSQTITPTTADSTLVNDPIALVDSPTALVGGATVSTSDMVLNMKTAKPKASIRIHR